MIEHLHDHMVEELKLNTRTDIIFVIVSIVLNLILLAVNSTIAVGTKEDVLVMIIFVFLIVIISFVAEIGLLKGKNTRSKLIKGLMKIYKDNNIDQYYDKDLIRNSEIRYNLFIISVLATAIVSIIVPFLALRG